MSARPQPGTLYKYRAFNVNTLRLLTEAEVYYANPADFNDPLDSSPTIHVDTDYATLEQVLVKILAPLSGIERAKSTIGNHRYMSTEVGDFKDDPEAAAYNRRRIADDIRRHLAAELGRRGVLSLAGRWNCPLMWSHYADDHKGICIGYSMADTAFRDLQPVDYRGPRAIRMSKLAEWKLGRSDSARREIAHTFFYSKAPEWRYEREWRDVSERHGSSSAPARISEIHFGLRCDNSVITAIVNLLARPGHPLKFYAIRSRDESFRLQRTRVDVDEIRAGGIRSSTLLDFRDVFVDETDA